eukprot:47990-Alexandrium_andersonii.AAC.1
MEICCSEDSVLVSAAGQLLPQRVHCRASYWNGHDLSRKEGVSNTLRMLEKLRPEHVWISTPCGAFSQLQQLNQRDEGQRARLEAKRLKAQ